MSEKKKLVKKHRYDISGFKITPWYAKRKPTSGWQGGAHAGALKTPSHTHGNVREPRTRGAGHLGRGGPVVSPFRELKQTKKKGGRKR